MMFFISIGVMFVITIAATICVVLLGNVAHKLLVRVLASEVSGEAATEIAVETILVGISKFPVVISVALMAIGSGSCGTLALVFGTFVQFLHVSKMYKDNLEKVVKKSLGLAAQEKQIIQNLGPLNFQLSLGLLWVITTVLNMSSLLAWTHDSVLKPLAKDHSYLISLVMCLSLPVLWNEKRPSKFKKYYPAVTFVLQLTAILIMLYGLVMAYRINYFIAISVVTLCLQQLFAPFDYDKTFIGESSEDEPNENATINREQEQEIPSDETTNQTDTATSQTKNTEATI